MFLHFMFKVPLGQFFFCIKRNVPSDVDDYDVFLTKIPQSKRLKSHISCLSEDSVANISSTWVWPLVLS